MNRKRWFVKVMWAYIPCSVEGIMVAIISAASIICGIFLISFLEKSYGVDLNVIKIIFFSVILITALSIAKRHS